MDSERLPYHAPVIENHGTVAELTAGSNPGVGDSGYIGSDSVTPGLS